MSSSDWSWYTSEADKLYQDYPVSGELFIGDYQQWAEESLQISKDYVYNGKSPVCQYYFGISVILWRHKRKNTFVY